MFWTVVAQAREHPGHGTPALNNPAMCQARIAKLNFGAVLEHAATSKAILQHSIESFGNRRQSSPASAATFCKYGRCRKVDQLQLQYTGQPRPVSGNSKT